MPRQLLERGWRYTLVGLVCAIANYIIMLAVDFLGGHYLLGTVVSFIIVTPSAYLMHTQFTFAESLSWQAFARFVGTIAATYPIAVFMLMILCSGLKLSVAIAIPIATAALFVWNFIAAHWAIVPRLKLGPAMAANHQSVGDDKL